jgi:hypothetical protein
MDSIVVFLSGLPSQVTKDQVAFRLCLHGPHQSLELFEGSEGLVARVEMKTPTQAQLLMTTPPSFWDDRSQIQVIGAESLTGQALAEVWEAQRHGPPSLPGDAA